MTRRLVVPALLDSFLGTFTSRYSDFDGYWLFGFLVDDLSDDTALVQIDLLGDAGKSDDPPAWAFARQLAMQRFSEQAGKYRVPRSWLRTAQLAITMAPKETWGVINGRIATGRMVRFAAHAVTDLGRVYDRTRWVFVAPHDPGVESRNLRTR